MADTPRSDEPELLDLYCCGGGCALGYRRAGFLVTGVDIAPQPRFPFPFFQRDALEFLRGEGRRFDAIHASPPCHDHTVLAKRTGRLDGTGWLLAATRAALGPAIDMGTPVVIENVVGAEMRCDLLLCGTMFPELRVRRHRQFEIYNATVPQPEHTRRHPLTHTLDKRKAHYGMTDEWRDFVQVTGGGNSTVAAACDAMGIDAPFTKYEVNQALPPAYTVYIGKFLREHLAGAGG